LIKRRVVLVREEAKAAARAGNTSGSRAESRRREPEPEVLDDSPESSQDDSVDRFAQDSFGALERFGAELEALFIGAPTPRPARNAEETREPKPQTPPRPAAPTTLAETEAELNGLLMEEGIVVRSHDVARVVSLMSGKEVQWTE
jgi:hypothetical protein